MDGLAPRSREKPGSPRENSQLRGKEGGWLSWVQKNWVRL